MDNNIFLHYYKESCNNPRYPDTAANAIRTSMKFTSSSRYYRQKTFRSPLKMLEVLRYFVLSTPEDTCESRCTCLSFRHRNFAAPYHSLDKICLHSFIFLTAPAGCGALSDFLCKYINSFPTINFFMNFFIFFDSINFNAKLQIAYNICAFFHTKNSIKP